MYYKNVKTFEMISEYIQKNYKENEPIFFSDLPLDGKTKSALNQQLKTMCAAGALVKYDTGIYYLPKKTKMKTAIGPSADAVAKYRFIMKNGKIDGFYAGNTFANQLGISTQVPHIVEIVSNNTCSVQREILIGKRKFLVKQPVTEINADNVYTLQLLDLLKNLDKYLDYDYSDARKKVTEFIVLHNISRELIDRYIRKYPVSVFKFYYELRLDDVFT